MEGEFADSISGRYAAYRFDDAGFDQLVTCAPALTPDSPHWRSGGTAARCTGWPQCGGHLGRRRLVGTVVALGLLSVDEELAEHPRLAG